MSNLQSRPVIQRERSPESFLDSLVIHLESSFNILKEKSRCAVLFSGGVDSTLAAVMTHQSCDDVLLITACGRNSHDAVVAKGAADALGLAHTEVELNSEMIWKTLPKIIKIIGKSRRMDIEIALPFFFAAKEAYRNGFQTMISGQGPDELFAGYARYERFLVEQGAEKVERELWADFSTTDEANIQRDKSVIQYHNIEAVFPYLHHKFAETALTIPATLNIDPNKTPSRKLLFRKLALRFGIPEKIAMTPKRATQYSSGTTKLLTKSLRENIEELRGLSRKQLNSQVQSYLDSLNSR